MILTPSHNPGCSSAILYGLIAYLIIISFEKKIEKNSKNEKKFSIQIIRILFFLLIFNPPFIGILF